MNNIVKRIYSFSENINPEISSNNFFNDFYLFLFGNTKKGSIGIFEEIASYMLNVVDSTSEDDFINNATLWINYNTLLTKENLTELENEKYLEYNRLLPPEGATQSTAFINKNEDNDRSIFYFKEHLDVNKESYTIQKILSFFKSEIQQINSKISGNRIIWEINSKEQSLEKIVWNKLQNLFDENSYLSYILLLKKVFNIIKTSDSKSFIYSPKYSYAINLTPNGIDDFYGSILVFSEGKIEDDFFLTKLPIIKELFVSIKLIEHDYIQRRKLVLLRNANTKSAISSIMSRNGSHNIGSHVLSSVGYKINDPTDVQTLTKYIQQRWDFLAQVTYDFPKWSLPVKLIAQLLRGFYEQRLLLNNIVLSEGLSAQEGFELPVTEGKLQIEILKNYKDKDAPEPIWKYDSSPNSDYAKVFHNDIDIAIPGGVTGFHAFYTILENFIRNSAKHAYKQEKNNDKGLKISVEFTDLDNYVEFFVYDNIPSSEDIQKNLNKKIKNSLLNENGQLSQKDWGIAEMKIAASYLRMIDFVDVDQIPNKDDNSILYEREELRKSSGNLAKFIIKAELKDEKYLGYKFAVPKPMGILILGDEEKEFKKAGIYIKKYPFVEEKSDIHQFSYVVACKGVDYGNLLSDLPINTICFEKDTYEALKKLDYEENTKDNQSEKITAVGELKKAILKYYLQSINKSIKIHINTSDDFTGSIGVNNEDIWKYFIYKIGRKFPEIARLNLTDSEKKVITNFFTKIDPEEMSRDPWKTFESFLGGHHKSLYDKILLSKHTVEANYAKYEEDIETVPPYFKLSNSAVSGEQSWKNIINITLDLKENLKFVDDYSKDKKNTIVLKRHFSPSDQYMYAESLSGAQSYFNYLHRPPEKVSQKIDILIDIIKTATYSVKIVDERFEEFMRRADTSIQDRIKACKIESLLVDELNLKKDGKNEEDNNVILIIHLGILQKILKEHKGINDMKKLIEILHSNIAQRLYITSGKGKSKDLPDDVKFIPFADIQSTLMKAYPEKMILVKILSNIKS